MMVYRCQKSGDGLSKDSKLSAFTCAAPLPLHTGSRGSSRRASTAASSAASLAQSSNTLSCCSGRAVHFTTVILILLMAMWSVLVIIVFIYLFSKSDKEPAGLSFLCASWMQNTSDRRYHKFYTTIRIVKKYHDTQYCRDT